MWDSCWVYLLWVNSVFLSREKKPNPKSSIALLNACIFILNAFEQFETFHLFTHWCVINDEKTVCLREKNGKGERKEKENKYHFILFEPYGKLNIHIIFRSSVQNLHKKDDSSDHHHQHHLEIVKLFFFFQIEHFTGDQTCVLFQSKFSWKKRKQKQKQNQIKSSKTFKCHLLQHEHGLCVMCM